MGNEEKDQKTEKGIDDPILKNEWDRRSELGARIKIISDSLGSRKKAAAVAGVSEAMIYRYISGENDLPLAAAGELARASGYSLQWIILGEGPMKTTPQVTEEHTAYTSAASHSLDLDRLEEAMGVVERYLEERGVARSRKEMLQLVACFYDISRRKGLIKKNDLVGLLDLIYKEHGPG